MGSSSSLGPESSSLLQRGRGETGCGAEDGLDLTVSQLLCDSEQVRAFSEPLD